jgi:hypothetical protein
MPPGRNSFPPFQDGGAARRDRGQQKSGTDEGAADPEGNPDSFELAGLDHIISGLSS